MPKIKRNCEEKNKKSNDLQTKCKLMIDGQTCAKSFSREFFLFVLMKHDAGNIIQMPTPIVEPFKPITNSIDGVKMPTIIVENTIKIVMY